MDLRDLTTIDEFRRVVELEKLVWGYADAEDVVPVPILAVTVKRGGVLIGAFDGAVMVGFVYSLPGLKQGRPLQWSHMLGVLASHRGSGLGVRLKLEQRLRTLAMGLDLVEWTFDPLQAVNAHLNFARLGIQVEEYLENVYGESSSPLHRGAPTDRFVAQWWIRTPAVEQRIAPERPSIVRSVEMLDAVPVNLTRPSGEWIECANVDLDQTAPSLSVEIPMGFSELLVQSPALAHAWRAATRRLFTTYFSRGYRAADFLLDRPRARGYYLLKKIE